MMEARERESLAPYPQMNDARPGFLRLKTEISQQPAKPLQRGLSLLTGAAHHQRIVGIAHQDTVLTHIPHPVKAVQVHVAEDG